MTEQAVTRLPVQWHHQGILNTCIISASKPFLCVASKTFHTNACIQWLLLFYVWKYEFIEKYQWAAGQLFNFMCPDHFLGGGAGGVWHICDIFGAPYFGRKVSWVTTHDPARSDLVLSVFDMTFSCTRVKLKVPLDACFQISIFHPGLQQTGLNS